MAFPEPKEYVESVTERLKEFHDITDRLYFLSMDLAINDDGFKGAVERSEEVLILLRRKYRQEAAEITFKHIINPQWKGDAYPKLPPGTAFINTGEGLRVGTFIPYKLSFSGQIVAVGPIIKSGQQIPVEVERKEPELLVRPDCICELCRNQDIRDRTNPA